MAEVALLTGIATSVLKQLSSPALDEFRLLWSHKKHFEKLENTVTTIQNVLQDADSKQATDAAVRGWLARLRAVLYEADDFFDSISAKVSLEKAKEGNEIGKKVRHFVSKPTRFVSLIKNSHKVKKIREHFDDIARDINGFKFFTSQPDQDPKISKIGREQTHSYVRRDAVVGREREAENLVRVLLDDSSQQQSRGFSVVAVIGIGGLGKTTLAQLVYNDDRVQKGFDLVMWACMDKISDQKQVLLTLLKSATMRQRENLVSELENLDLEELQYKFRKEIEGKRFFLVLDDVWDVDVLSWGKLKEQLSSGNDGSKVLTTTQSTAIAQRLWAIKPYFHLQVLSDESAWLLFKKIAFTNEEDWNDSELEKLGRLIKKKCANVPLAIVIIASLLREKEKERWPLVNDELSNLFPYGYDNIMQVLEFSYKELPYPVKRCFGYCSLFPKDYKFNKDRLIHLWIAQGFIEPSQNQSLEDRGEEYFFWLVDRCFFHKIVTHATYQMHDLIHDLAIKVAGSENILVDHTPQGSWDKTVLHVSITYDYVSIVDHVCSFPHSKSLRTFLYDDQFRWKKDSFCSKLINVEKLVPCFKSLRVLVLRDIREVPTSIGELIHLRYLDLSHSDMGRLPSSICSLCHLQYLILRCRWHLSELPDNLGELIQLRHLDLSYSSKIKRLPTSICRLLHLESLILTSCTCLEELPEELGELTQLRYLDLSSNNRLKRLPSSICRLLHLESLILRSCKFLELSEELGELTQLRYLDLSSNNELKRLPSSICRLLHLESLILQSLTLEELPEEMGVLQRLRHLALEYCNRLVISMSTLMSLMSLKKLVIDIPRHALNYLDDLPTRWLSTLPLTASNLQIVLPSIELENSKTDVERSFRESRLRELTILCDIRLDSGDIQPKYKLISFCLKDMWPVNFFLEPASSNTEVNVHQLPPNVKELKIIYFGGKEMPHWVSCLNKLATLKLNGCEQCVKLPSLSAFPALKELEICGMSSLLNIEDSYNFNCFFPSLETLSICDMSNLMSRWLQPPTVLPTFPCLKYLRLENVREEIIWQTIGSEAIYSTTNGNIVLKKLNISNIEDLSIIAEAQIRHLSALQHLTIGIFGQLESVAVNCLASLESLEIECDRINLDGHEAHFSRLRHLSLPTMNKNLFKGLKDMTSLESLTIWRNFNEELQEGGEDEEGIPWKHLQKLESMELAFGEGFRMRNNLHLLHGLQHLISLTRLKLRKCRALYLPWRALIGLLHLQFVEIYKVEEVIGVDSDVTMIHTKPIYRSSMELTICGVIYGGSSGEWVHDIPWKSLTFLKELNLRRLNNLKSLPEGIRHLSALERLNIWGISSVVSFPDWMSSLLSLTRLYMRGISSELQNRCDKATGEDWPKIRHIPEIDIPRWQRTKKFVEYRNTPPV